MSKDELHIPLAVSAQTNSREAVCKSVACLQETRPPWRVLKQKKCQERRICKQPAQQ